LQFPDLILQGKTSCLCDPSNVLLKFYIVGFKRLFGNEHKQRCRIATRPPIIPEMDQALSARWVVVLPS
jgi:hypothetical protein